MSQNRPIIDETWTDEDCERQFKREREQNKRARKKAIPIAPYTHRCKFCSAQYKSAQEALDHVLTTHCYDII